MITIGLYTNENERIFRMLDDFMSTQGLFYRILVYSSAEELFSMQEKHYVLFLDIDCSKADRMAGIDGVEIAKKVRYVNRGVILIFTSRQKNCLLRAMNEAHPFAFLVRPISKKQLIFQMNELKTFINYQIKKDDTIKLKLINLSEDGVLGFDYKKIAIRDIFCFEYVNRKIKVCLENEEYYFMDTLKNIASQIQHYSFESCHKSCIVNLEHIKQIKGYEIILKNGKRLRISQKKSSEFRKKMKSYLESTKN